MTSYFYDCLNKEEAKSKYRKLAKELHPDHGGTKEKFQDLQKQYESFIEVDSGMFFRSDHESFKNAFDAMNKEYAKQYEEYQIHFEIFNLRSKISTLTDDLIHERKRSESELRPTKVLKEQIEELKKKLRMERRAHTILKKKFKSEEMRNENDN